MMINEKSWKHCDILPKGLLSRNVKVFYIPTNRGRLVAFLFLSPLIKKKRKENKPKPKKNPQNQKQGNPSLFKSFFFL